MAVAVMPHAPKPTEIHLRQLNVHIQAVFDDLMREANTIASPATLDLYLHIHEDAARIIGIQLPAGRELAVCTCTACYCDIVCPASQVRSYMDGRHWHTQCPACADDHLICP